MTGLVLVVYIPRQFLALSILALHGILVAGFTNPIKQSGPDPFMVYNDGFYYLTTTTAVDIQITRAATINELKSATPKVIWKDSDPSRCCNLWAPEIHWQPNESAWYIYYAAGTSGTVDNQRMHALRGSSANIWDSTWSYAGRFVPPNRDAYAIDGTVLVVGSNRYLVYSSWDGPNQCLFIAPMINATTVGDCVKISTPTLPWEMVGLNVNEGPAALHHEGRTWIIYSASYCDGTGYKLGRLELTGTDPLDPNSWTKFGEPVFESANGSFQPGHNGFFESLWE